MAGHRVARLGEQQLPVASPAVGDGAAQQAGVRGEDEVVAALLQPGTDDAQTDEPGAPLSPPGPRSGDGPCSSSRAGSGSRARPGSRALASGHGHRLCAACAAGVQTLTVAQRSRECSGLGHGRADDRGGRARRRPEQVPRRASRPRSSAATAGRAFADSMPARQYRRRSVMDRRRCRSCCVNEMQMVERATVPGQLVAARGPVPRGAR